MLCCNLAKPIVLSISNRAEKPSAARNVSVVPGHPIVTVAQNIAIDRPSMSVISRSATPFSDHSLNRVGGHVRAIPQQRSSDIVEYCFRRKMGKSWCEYIAIHASARHIH
uniref:(northern house mosquito) hypothetical protein n=1 Tax=Culex pipiens TaxID=7175 RepID=A0A8D8FDR1_CULPI